MNFEPMCDGARVTCSELVWQLATTRRTTHRRSAIIQAYRSRMRVLQLLGVLLFVPSALAFYHLVDRGTDSALVYLTGASMYVGLAFALYASVMLWGSDD